jgi:membrane protease YdiL (CAAX protease family)
MSPTIRLLQLFAVLFYAYLGVWRVFGLREIWGWSAFALVLIIIGSERDRLDMGFSFGNRFATLTSIGAVLLVATLTVACAAQEPCTFETVILKRLGYVAGALLQEFLLQSFLFTRFESLVGTRNAILPAAGIFATLHLFNPVLTPLTLVMGYALTWLFQRNRSLIMTTAIHAIIGVTGLLVLPGKYMVVGIGYQLRP